MRFFEPIELRYRAPAGDHLKAFETHGVIGAVVIAAPRKAGLKRVVHGASVLPGSEVKSEAAISCHFQSDASMVSSAVRNVSKNGRGTRKITFLITNRLLASTIHTNLGRVRQVC